MIEVIDCIAYKHDLRLVAVAVLVCLIGSVATVQLFGRILATRGRGRAGWIGLCAVGTGTMVWCTHFVAMMGFEVGVPVTLDPVVTLGSLGIAIVLAAPGLALAATGGRGVAKMGGAIVGIAISAMHYVGMIAFRIDGVVEWRSGYVAVSILLSSLLAAAAFTNLRKGRRWVGGSLIGAAVAILHFTGMAAMRIAVLELHPEQGLSEGAMTQLAIGTACAGLLFVGCAAVSALIDGETQSDAFRRMRRMALHDGLTDLPNRLCFNEELEMRRARTEGKPHMAVLMLDLARFKHVNDTYGHQAGDQLLIALASRMTSALKTGEFLARLGGDEFAALVSFTERAELDGFIERLSAVFSKPFSFERFSAAIDANIGISLAPLNGTDADTLLARADLAMYRAKSNHSVVPCFYDATMDDVAREQRELGNELREALKAGQFEMHYQVQASIETGEITGYEALIRWRHPIRGLISPVVFIPLAEKLGEIIPLSRWILAQACFEAATWPNQYIVSVNLSPLHLSDAELTSSIRDALRNSGLPPKRLTLELTEGAIIRDRNYALDQLKQIKALGVGLALDDFGVGYSSIDVLRSFPFDRIKLDKSFVDEIEDDPQAEAILHAIVALGDTLCIPVLTEGIENAGQLAIAARAGCSSIQGYLIGRPTRSLVDPAYVRAVLAGKRELDSDLSLVA